MSHAKQLPECRSLPDDREIINRPGLPNHQEGRSAPQGAGVLRSAGTRLVGAVAAPGPALQQATMAVPPAVVRGDGL